MSTSSMSNHNYGNLEIILGCMRSGKTTELIRKKKDVTALIKLS